MDLVLNIYEGREIQKIYKTDTYDLMFGTLEDILSLIDGVKLNEADNTDKLIDMVTGGVGKLKPFLKDVFPGVTDEELRRTKVKEIIPIFIEVLQYAFTEIGVINKGKN